MLRGSTVRGVGEMPCGAISLAVVPNVTAATRSRIPSNLPQDKAFAVLGIGESQRNPRWCAPTNSATDATFTMFIMFTSFFTGTLGFAPTVQKILDL